MSHEYVDRGYNLFLMCVIIRIKSMGGQWWGWSWGVTFFQVGGLLG
jgi:hypothetical protein